MFAFCTGPLDFSYLSKDEKDSQLARCDGPRLSSQHSGTPTEAGLQVQTSWGNSDLVTFLNI